jgi:hypothetical protein
MESVRWRRLKKVIQKSYKVKGLKRSETRVEYGLSSRKLLHS